MAFSRTRRLRGPARGTRDALVRMWRSGGLLMLGALAAGMTAFPARTLVMLRPFSDGIAFVWRAGLGTLGTVVDTGRASTRAIRGLAYRASESDELKRQVLALEAKNRWREEQQRRLVRLAQLLELKKDLARPARAARVIGGDPSTLFNALVIDVGTRDGIGDSDAVVAPAGAVGRLLSVGAEHSVVLWLNDPRSRVAAYDQRSRVYGVLVGTGAGCELRYLSVGDDVKVGDRVLTAGRGSVFPKGLYVGLVKEIRREGLLLVASVEPAVDVNRLEEVLVLTRGGPGP